MIKEITETRSLDMNADDFRNAGHELVDRLGIFLETLPHKMVTSGASPSDIRSVLEDQPLPSDGQDTIEMIHKTADLLLEHSLFNGHPRFWGYITSSPAPIGVLADMMASMINANVGAFALSPMATEIERQTVKWLAEFIGYPPGGGGLFVSGGTMANFLAFLAARKNKITGNLRKFGLPSALSGQPVGIWGYNPVFWHPITGKKQFTIYCADGTHTWILKAADLFGHGTDSIRWVGLNDDHRMDTGQLKEQIKKDKQLGHTPFMVVGNAGSVSTGVVDPLDEIAAICKEEGLWFHVDGAYGAPAAVLPELKDLFKGMDQADSIALDPHKWLYSPLEAGCILVRDSRHLKETFSFQPDYYNFDGNGAEMPLNFHEYGVQNSRGFRALKVWLSLKQVGKKGMSAMIREDINLAGNLFQMIIKKPELTAVSHNLSITTFRYVPRDQPQKEAGAYLNLLNKKLLDRIQAGGKVFLSNAIVDGAYCLRACLVNFRTTYKDLETLLEVVIQEGKKLHYELSAGSK